MLNRLDDAELAAQREPQVLLPLVAKTLCYTYDNVPLLSDICFTLKANAKTVIMGPNGAGKSLLLRTLHGLIEPTSGTITWAGKQADIQTREHQAMVFQKPVLLRRSTYDNMAFVLRKISKSDRSHRIDELLELARLKAHAKTPARLLSGGEQQRLAIARALSLDPQILFLDEPTASLDPSSTQAVEAMIATAHRSGTKVVLVTHDIGQAKRVADDVLFIDHGNLTEHTPAREFFEQPRSPAASAYLSGQLYLE